jgi:hypothetical protein
VEIILLLKKIMFGLNPIFYDCHFGYTKILGEKKQKKPLIWMKQTFYSFYPQKQIRANKKTQKRSPSEVKGFSFSIL